MLGQHQRGAQEWHDVQLVADDEHDVSSCWCCCISCDPDGISWGPNGVGEPNPFYPAAMDEMRAEMRGESDLS